MWGGIIEYQKIAEYMGTTSLSDGAQRLTTQTISENVASLKSKYKAVKIVYMTHDNACQANNGYYPIGEVTFPTDILVSSGSGQLQQYYACGIYDIYASVGVLVQIGFPRTGSTTVQLAMFTSGSITYKRGWILFGIK